MKPETAATEFVEFMARRALIRDDLTAEHGVPAMLAYYQEQRAEGCSFEHDADMLLFEWGTYDWGQGQFFQLGITRQLLLNDGGEDEDFWQLRLTFKFGSTDLLRDLRSGQRWCSNPGELAEFESFIRASGAYRAVAAVPPAAMDLQYECAG
jgi:hypothetical protein